MLMTPWVVLAIYAAPDAHGALEPRAALQVSGSTRAPVVGGEVSCVASPSADGRPIVVLLLDDVAARSRRVEVVAARNRRAGVRASVGPASVGPASAEGALASCSSPQQVLFTVHGRTPGDWRLAIASRTPLEVRVLAVRDNTVLATRRITPATGTITLRW